MPISSTRGDGKHVPVLWAQPAHQLGPPRMDGQTNSSLVPKQGTAAWHVLAKPGHSAWIPLQPPPSPAKSLQLFLWIWGLEGHHGGPGRDRHRDAAGSVRGVCPVLLVVELQLDLVSDLVDEDLSQQDAHQLQDRRRRGKGEEKGDRRIRGRGTGRQEGKRKRKKIGGTGGHHPTVPQVGDTAPGEINIPPPQTLPP